MARRCIYKESRKLACGTGCAEASSPYKRRTPMTDKSEKPDPNDTSRVTEDHRALQNQSSVTADQYPKAQREAQSLVQPDKKAKKKKAD